VEDKDKVLIGDKLCFLCGESKEKHLGYILENKNNDDLIDDDDHIRNNILSNDILINELNNQDNKIDQNLIISNNNNLKKSIKKETCGICNELYIENDENKLKQCGHSYCNDCWYNFLSIKIKENKLSLIKCLNYECQEKLSDNFIINILKSNKELINKYKKYKFELDIINDPNKKFCPYPNCNSYAILKNIKNKNVKCFNNHEFCFFCLEKPHGKKPCQEKLDKSMILFSKNNFIKKCPHCGIITEKTSGCNHITCSKCNYQWCWLCNEEYNVEHFRQGKCKGFQFYRPKNEKEIQLAFEGKIILNESQRQSDINDEGNFHNRRRRHDIRNRRARNIGDFEDDDFRRRRRDRYIEDFQYISRIQRIKMTIISLLIYIFFGQIIISINFNLSLLDRELINPLYQRIYIISASLVYALIITTIFFLQIIINIIILIPYILFKGLIVVKDIRDNIFRRYEAKHGVLYHIHSFVFFSTLYILGADCFLYFYYKNKHSKIFCFFYYFIVYIHIFIFFSYSISFGIIKYSLDLLFRKTKFIEELNELN
jgi:hypothetical protein